MTPIAAMVLEMIGRGIDAEVIALAVSTAEQTIRDVSRPQISADMSADRRREKDRLRKQEIRRNPQKSAEIPQTTENASISKDIKKDSKRQNRGARIASDWTPSDAERSFAKQEGFSDWEIQREAQKFRDYWMACAGSKGVKLDWSATWRQWIRSGADRAGKTPLPPIPAGGAIPNSFYAAADSEQLAAWDTYGLRTTGKGMPRDKNQGWRVKSEWPPDHDRLPLDQPAQEAAE
jgi:hypothetical protein